MILNFCFDFILLLSVSIILRRNVSIYKIILGSLVGGISILFLFLKINKGVLILYKFLISVFMIISSFSYKNIKYTLKNLFFFYTSSIVLGGFLYFLNVNFSYKQIGLVFINKGLSVNFIFLIIFSPIIIYIYVKQSLILKNNYSNYYKLNIFYDNNKYMLNAFLDTGNVLTVPITNKPVLLVNCNINPNKYFFIPYKCIKGNDLLKCFKVDKIEINGIIKNNVIVGLLNEKINIDGVDCLLNKKILEE